MINKKSLIQIYSSTLIKWEIMNLIPSLTQPKTLRVILLWFYYKTSWKWPQIMVKLPKVIFIYLLCKVSHSALSHLQLLVVPPDLSQQPLQWKAAICIGLYLQCKKDLWNRMEWISWILYSHASPIFYSEKFPVLPFIGHSQDPTILI